MHTWTSQRLPNRATYFAAQLVRPCSAALEFEPPWPTWDLYMLYLAAEQRRGVSVRRHPRHTGASHVVPRGVTRGITRCHTQTTGATW